MFDDGWFNCISFLKTKIFTHRRGDYTFIFITTASFGGMLEISVAIVMILTILVVVLVPKEMDVPTFTGIMMEEIVTEIELTSGKTEIYCLMKVLQLLSCCCVLIDIHL